MAFSPDGKTIAATSRSTGSPSETRIWDKSSFKLKYTIPVGHELDWRASIQFSADGKLLAAGGDTSVKLCDPQSGEVLHTLPSQKNMNYVTAMRFSPDGKTLAVARLRNDDVHFEGRRPIPYIQMWDVQSGRLIKTYYTGQAEVMAISSDFTRTICRYQPYSYSDIEKSSPEIQIRELRSWASGAL